MAVEVLAIQAYIFVSSLQRVAAITAKAAWPSLPNQVPITDGCTAASVKVIAEAK